MSAFEYVVGFGAGVIAVALLHCGAQAEETRELPPSCYIQPEKVKAQLCPEFDYDIGCFDVASTNPDPLHCTGYAYRQVTGNDWCCYGTPNYTVKQ